MPGLRQRVQTMLLEKEHELQGYGENPSVSRGTMNAFVLDVITKYLDAYQDLMAGRSNDDAGNVHFVSKGGARISRLFMDVFEPQIEKLPGLKSLSDSDVFFLMKNHAGLTVPLFTPHKAFDTILFRTIEQMRGPSLSLIDSVASILFEIHAQVDFMELSRFTALADAIRSVVDECIRSCVNPTREYINGLIDNERSFVNTARPDFRGNQAMNAGKADDPRSRPLPEKPAVPDPVGVCSIYGASKEMTNHQSSEMKDLVQIGTKYFDLIRDQIKDLVPKAVVRFLVDESTRLLRPKMIEAIFNTSDVGDLLQEDQTITRKRVACIAIVDALKKAQRILNEVRIFKA
jgi:dynamin 1-like protein